MINVSSAAASKITELLAEEQKQNSGLRVFVQGGGCSGFQYGLDDRGERRRRRSGVRVERRHAVSSIPSASATSKGAEVDFVDTVTGGGFTIKNPNATSTCGCGSSFTTEEGGGGTRPQSRNGKVAVPVRAFT